MQLLIERRRGVQIFMSSTSPFPGMSQNWGRERRCSHSEILGLSQFPIYFAAPPFTDIGDLGQLALRWFPDTSHLEGLNFAASDVVKLKCLSRVHACNDPSAEIFSHH